NENNHNLEMACWYQALAAVPGEITPQLIHVLIKEMSGTFLTTINRGFSFSLTETAEKLHAVSKGAVNRKELVFHLIAQLPHPKVLSDAANETLNQILVRTEKTYPDVIRRYESRLKKLKP